MAATTTLPTTQLFPIVVAVVDDAFVDEPTKHTTIDTHTQHACSVVNTRVIAQ